MSSRKPGESFKVYLGNVVYEADTPEGKAFDVAVLIAIFLSIIVVMLETVPSVESHHRQALQVTEWVLTIVFTLEYFLRVWLAYDAKRYIKSFFGIVDLLAVVPTYLSLIFPGAQSLIVFRALRLLRVFRVLKMVRYIGEANTLLAAMKASRPKITVFLYTVCTLVIILGTLMYMIEGNEHGFTSIPQSVYWTIVTLTTVGYGDITPQSPIGKLVSCVIMVLGYAIIAVPTGIVTVELQKGNASKTPCPDCGIGNHHTVATFCYSCGKELH